MLSYVIVDFYSRNIVQLKVICEVSINIPGIFDGDVFVFVLNERSTCCLNFKSAQTMLVRNVFLLLSYIIPQLVQINVNETFFKSDDF